MLRRALALCVPIALALSACNSDDKGKGGGSGSGGDEAGDDAGETGGEVPDAPAGLSVHQVAGTSPAALAGITLA